MYMSHLFYPSFLGQTLFLLKSVLIFLKHQLLVLVVMSSQTLAFQLTQKRIEDTAVLAENSKRLNTNPLKIS